ncbi:MAG TPA: cytochrome c oxidase subunit II [Balneolaceae bacterium]|nr:cytochrome c oxidase subunit II [Balneolaceae bacterium]
MNELSKLFLPPEGSTVAHQTDALFWFVHISGLILTVGLVAVIVYFVFKYRRKSEDEVTPVITHNNTLEITWSVIPLIFVLIVFGWGYKVYMKEQTVPDDAYEVNVTAQQWAWGFNYENGAHSMKELHVPAGRPIKLVMKSRDVIHSFYVPAFRLKQDVLPNRYTELWFNAPKPGRYQIFCAEYCGTGHSHMLGTVVVQKPQDFQTWLAKNKGGASASNLSPAKLGKQVYDQYACSSCHSTDGSKMTGPSWKGIYGSKVQLASGKSITVDDDYIRESILHPQAKVVKGYQPVMPSFQGQLSDDQIKGIIEYIKTLK